MRYLVTGGCGFIGSHIAEALVEEGHEVTVYDNLSSGHEENITHLGTRVEFLHADIRDFPTLAQAVGGCDGIFHEAALVSVFESVKKPLENHEVNITGTLNVLGAARARGVRRVVFAGSAAVYGNEPTLPKTEAMRPDPESPYALAKAAGEYYTTVFHRAYGLETVSLRYFNVYGPHQDPQSVYAAVIPKFITAMLEGQRPTIFGDGEQSRDFTFIDDVVGANLLACTAPEASGHALNVACGGRYSLNELVRVLNGILGTSIEPVYADERPGDVKHSQADISAARRILAYEPSHTLEQGLRKTIEWYSA